MSKFVGVLSYVAKWFASALLVVLLSLPLIIGFYAVACPSDNPLGMALVAIIGVAAIFPALLALIGLLALVAWPSMRLAASSMAFSKIVKWWAMIMVVSGLLAWLVSQVIGVTVRCSMLW